MAEPPVMVLPMAFNAASQSFFRTISLSTNSEMLMMMPARIPPRITRPKLMPFMASLLLVTRDPCAEESEPHDRTAPRVSQREAVVGTVSTGSVGGAPERRRAPGEGPGDPQRAGGSEVGAESHFKAAGPLIVDVVVELRVVGVGEIGRSHASVARDRNLRVQDVEHRADDPEPHRSDEEILLDERVPLVIVR